MRANIERRQVRRYQTHPVQQVGVLRADDQDLAAHADGAAAGGLGVPDSFPVGLELQVADLN
jgi:hypothetical protein